MAIKKRSGIHSPTEKADYDKIGSAFGQKKEGFKTESKPEELREFLSDAIIHVINRTGSSVEDIAERIGVPEFSKKHLLGVISGEMALSEPAFELLTTALSLAPYPEVPKGERSRDYNRLYGVSWLLSRKVKTFNESAKQNGHSYAYIILITDEIYAERKRELQENPLPSLFPENEQDMAVAAEDFYEAVLQAVKKEKLFWMLGRPPTIDEVLPKLAKQAQVDIWELEGLRRPEFFRRKKGDHKIVLLDDPAVRIADALYPGGVMHKNGVKDVIEKANALFTAALHLPPLQAQCLGTERSFDELMQLLNPRQSGIQTKFTTLVNEKNFIFVTDEMLQPVFEEYGVVVPAEQEALRQAVIKRSNARVISGAFDTRENIVQKAEVGHLPLKELLYMLRVSHFITQEDAPRVVPVEEVAGLNVRVGPVSTTTEAFLSCIGVSSSAVSLHELGKSIPPEDTLRNYAAFYNMSDKIDLFMRLREEALQAREEAKAVKQNGAKRKNGAHTNGVARQNGAGRDIKPRAEGFAAQEEGNGRSSKAEVSPSK